MLAPLIRAFNQLSDPAIQRILVWSVLGALLGFLALAGLSWLLLFNTDLTGVPWLDPVVDVLGGLSVLVLAYFLFPAVVIAIAGLLLDQVVAAVERRHYPRLPPPRPQGMVETAWQALRFFLVVAALNLLTLPLYLVLFFVPPFNLVLFYTVNGYLLSREYFEAVALRRLDPAGARRLRRSHGLRLFAAGVIIAFLSTVPVLNLVVPVIGTAFMVHLFHGLTGSRR